MENVDNFRIKKYPRTQHVEGSRLQPGDEDLSQIPFDKIKDKYIVIEEKVDGANTAISFDEKGNMLLQSRGHYLIGGNRERHYNLFKTWASVHQEKLYNVLGSRYIMYGEWLYAKHTVFYDNLDHYFLEFDVFDRINEVFLDTNERRKLLKDLPISSCKVLATGKFKSLNDVLKYLGKSNYKTENHIEILRQTCLDLNLDPNTVLKETDNSNLMEGLYIKVEENGVVIDRMKYVRRSFCQALEESNSHWIDRPIVPNKINKDLKELLKYD